jgi:hypothetical protein
MRGLLLALLCLAGTACHPTPRFTAWRTAPSLIIARSSGCAAAVATDSRTLYLIGGLRNHQATGIVDYAAAVR